MSGFEGFDQRDALVAQLRATAPVAPERLRQRVMELAPGSRRRLSSKRRLVLVVVPVAAALAVGAALVHGFVNSGPSLSAAPQKLTVLGRSGVTKHVLAGQAPNTPTADAPAYSAAGSLSQNRARTLAPAPERAAPHEALVIPKDRLVHADAS